MTFLLLRGHLARYILLFKSKNRMGTLCFVTSVSFFHSLSCTLRATSCSLLCKQPHIIWPYWQFALGMKLRLCLWGCILSVSQLDNLKDKDYYVKHCSVLQCYATLFPAPSPFFLPPSCLSIKSTWDIPCHLIGLYLSFPTPNPRLEKTETMWLRSLLPLGFPPERFSPGES